MTRPIADHNLLWRLPPSNSTGVILDAKHMPALRRLREQGFAVRHLAGWRRTPKGDTFVSDPFRFFADFGAEPTGIPCPPVTRTVPTTMPCATAPARARRFPAWVVGLVGLAAGAAMAQLWRLLALLVVLVAVTGCRDSWRIEHWEGEDRACRAPGGFAANPQNCFPCRTTDFVDARRVCDAAGIRKAGAK